MRSRFKVLGHPLHPILIVFTLGLYPIALVADLVFVGMFFIGGKLDGFWWTMANWTLLFGLLGTLAAGLPGFVDWLNIPGDAPSKNPATFHLITSGFIITLTLASMALRGLHNGGAPPSTLNYGPDSGFAYVAIGLNLFMNILLGFQGWLGGHLVYVHGIGVESSDKIDPIATMVDADTAADARREARRV